MLPFLGINAIEEVTMALQKSEGKGSSNVWLRFRL